MPVVKKLEPEDIKREVRLFSPHAPDKAATILKERMDKLRGKPGFMVYGSGTQHKMKLIYAKQRGNKTFAPNLIAKMSPYDGGTLIEGVIRQKRKSPMLFYKIWFLFLVPFVLIGIGTFVLGKVPLMFSLIWNGIVGLMLITGVFIARTEKPEKPKKDVGTPEKLISYLAKTIDAREM